MNRLFTKEDIQIAGKHKNVLNSLVIRENQIKITAIYIPLYTHQNHQNEKQKITKVNENMKRATFSNTSCMGE